MSELNPLNDLSRIYLDKVALMNRQEEQNDVERWQGVLDDQMEKSSKELATLGAPTMEEEKKAAKDYDGDGKVESGKEEYFGSKDKAIKKAMKKEELELDEAERELGDRLHRKRKLYDRTVTKAMDYARREGEAAGHARYRMGQLDREMDKVKDKMKKEGRFSDWRNDLSDLIEVAPMTDVEMEKEVTEKKVNNKVVINPKMSEAVAQIGGEVISETEVELQEKHKDTPDQVKAVIAYDRARHATDDATYDTMHGKKKQAKKERDYAKWQRDTGARDAQKSGHPWEHEKYGTREKEGKKSVKHAHVKDSVEYILDNLHNLNEADIADILARLEKKRISKGGNPDESPLGKKTGRAMKSQQDKARKKAGVSEGVLGTKAKGILGKEVKELEKATYTMKDTPVVKADKTDTPNYKGNKFGVKEGDDWIQKAVKRPGAFTRKAKAAGQTVQQFAKTVDDNPGKYSTRTKRQANLAQTFASMKKEDVEELFYTLIAD